MANQVYQSATGSNIGTLLRLIQEDQNKSLAATPPASEPGSPIRGVIQGPLQAPEAPNSNRVVSLKPEGALQQGPQQPGVAPVAPGGSGQPEGVVAPRIPVAPVAAPSFDTGGGGGGGVVAPIAPVRPTPAAPGPSAPGPSAPSAPSSAPSPAPAAAPAIGTQIRASAPAPRPVATRTVPQARVGSLIVKNIKSTSRNLA